MNPHPQLTLAVAIRDDANFANYYSGPNQEVVDALKAQWTTSGESYIFLWGTSGVGCSHLLQSACHYAEARGHHSIYLPLDELVSFSTDVLEGIEQLPLIALDNIQAIAGNSEWEAALFHLYNRVQQRQGHLLIAANQAPNHLNIQLADLSSRLSWGTVYQLESLSDEQKLNMLRLRATRLGINMTDDVARYVLTRGPRDMQALCDLLLKLDAASLQAQRKITIPFVRETMEW